MSNTLIETSLSTRAEEFFINAHKSTNQQYGEHGYEYHLKEVAAVARYFASKVGFNDYETELAVAGAFGHDAVSDARLNHNDIVKVLHDARLAKICCNLCEDVWGVNREERNSPGYYKRICSDEISIFDKICDRIANVEHSIWSTSRMLKVYYEEHKKFKTALSTTSRFDIMWKYLDELFEENMHRLS